MAEILKLWGKSNLPKFRRTKKKKKKDGEINKKIKTKEYRNLLSYNGRFEPEFWDGKNADQFWINITERVARWLSLNSSASGTQTRSYQYSYVVRRVFRALSSIYDGAFFRKWLTNCSRRLFSQTNSRTNAWQGLNTPLVVVESLQ